MRFMMIVKASKDSEAGKMPGEDLLLSMGRFNEEMARAGVLLEGMGLKPSSKGARVRFSGDRRTVIDGPFTETKDLIAGFWLIRAGSLEEAIEWAKRSPNPHPGLESEIEIRPVYELEDFASGEGIEPHRRVEAILAGGSKEGAAPAGPCAAEEPGEEHRWLQGLVGEWTYEGECAAAPGKCRGAETVRSHGGLWVVCEGRGETPGGGTASTMLTLGFDPGRRRFVGTFLCSMMTHLWTYDGVLDGSGKTLVLDTEGPSMAGDGKMARYQEAIEVLGGDERVLRSRQLGVDGAWNPVATTRYRRAR